MTAARLNLDIVKHIVLYLENVKFRGDELISIIPRKDGRYTLLSQMARIIHTKQPLPDGHYYLSACVKTKFQDSSTFMLRVIQQIDRETSEPGDVIVQQQYFDQIDEISYNVSVITMTMTDQTSVKKSQWIIREQP